jgi:putative DNA primase/helicase
VNRVDAGSAPVEGNPAAALRQQEPSIPPTSNLQAAVDYARMGFYVFPVNTIRADACSCGGGKGCSPGKHPIGALVPRGANDASADARKIAEWWSLVPDANIGIATGAVSQLVVLDVDGPKGEQTLAEYEAQHGPLPPTRQARTGKGRHLYFRYPTSATKVKSIARQKLGLDVRGDGGYVVAPPSIHVSGRPYEFEDPNVELAECPDWVVGYANGTLKTRRPSSAGQPRVAGPSRSLNDREEAKLRSALAVIPADERETWLNIGLALHSLNWGQKGFEIWSDWSQTVPEKHDADDQERTWESFDCPYEGDKITIGTLYYVARQLGWVDDTCQTDFHTDLGNAKRLVARHGENIRFVPEWEKWIIWNDSRWQIDGDGAIMRLAKDTVEAMYSEAMSLSGSEREALLKHAMKSQGEARLRSMISLAQTEAEVVVAATRLDADPWLLGVQNGVVDLKSGKFRAALRPDFITKRANVVYNPQAECPNWTKFLDTVMGGDADLQRYIQRVVGYLLTGSVREEVMFFLYGTGRNGKSTFRETLHALLGDYALAADAGLLIERKVAGGASEEVARLKGRRLVAVNETAESEQLNEARVKFVTSQDMITARNLYGHFFDFFPTHKTFLATNHKPIIKGTDEGIWRRVQLVPFTVTIPEGAVEKDFRERRLMPELSGVLNWALEGLRDYQEVGLEPPEAVKASTDDYRNDMDVVGQWLAERCEVDPSARVLTSVAYQDYYQWAADEVGWEVNKLKWRRKLSDRGFQAKKIHGRRYILGLQLRPPALAEIDDILAEMNGVPPTSPEANAPLH